MSNPSMRRCATYRSTMTPTQTSMRQAIAQALPLVDTGPATRCMQPRCEQRTTGDAALAKRHVLPFLRGGAARTWARSPCLPSRLKISTGRSPAAPNQCGTCVSNSATSPAFIVMS